MENTIFADPFTYFCNSPAPDDSGVLGGLRLAVKDMFHIADMVTTAGNPDWAETHEVPVITASSVSTLMDAGARLIGKTITDELAYSLNGQNQHYGTVKNACSPDRIPGGSSSGSAAAVAQNLADIGLGTDTGGSIRVPASYNGLFGLRPTHGLVSMDGVVPLAPSFDTVGWMTRDLNAMIRVNQVLLPQQTVSDFTPTIAVANHIIGLTGHLSLINQWLEQTATEFDQLGEQLCPGLLETAADTFRILQGREIWQQHGEWISAVNPVFAADIAERLAWASQLTPSQQRIAEDRQQHLKQRIDNIFRHYDVLLFPTTPGPAPLLQASPESLRDYRQKLLGFTAIAGLCGLPQLHLPIGRYKGGCVGVSLIGKPRSEGVLCKLASKLMHKQ